MNVPIGLIQWTEGTRGAELGEYVQRLERLGYHELWLPEIFGREPFATAGYLLALTSRLRVSTGIANVYAHDADSAAQAANTLAEFSHNRFTLGLGVSHPVLVEPRGHTWLMPVPKMDAYLDRMKKAQILSPEATSKAPVIIAGHGPGLQKVAAKKANGLFLFLQTVDTVCRAREILGPEKQIHVVVRCALDANPTTARDLARRACAFYTSLPPYHRAWALEGFDESDWCMPTSDRLIDAICAWGDATAIKEKLTAYVDAGATHLVLYPCNPGEAYRADSAMSLQWHWDLLEAMAP